MDDKYFTTSDYNKFTNNILYAKIKTKKLINESDISRFIKNTDLNKKLKILRFFFHKKKFYKKTCLKNPKSLRKC